MLIFNVIILCFIIHFHIAIFTKDMLNYTLHHLMLIYRLCILLSESLIHHHSSLSRNIFNSVIIFLENIESLFFLGRKMKLKNFFDNSLLLFIDQA